MFVYISSDNQHLKQKVVCADRNTLISHGVDPNPDQSNIVAPTTTILYNPQSYGVVRAVLHVCFVRTLVVAFLSAYDYLGTIVKILNYVF